MACKASPEQVELTAVREGKVRHWYRTLLKRATETTPAVYDAETGGCGHVRLDADRPGPAEPFTDEVIDAWLARDLGKCEAAIDELSLSLPEPLDQHEIDALADLLFNCGIGALMGNIGKAIRAGNRQAAGDYFLAWCHAPAGTVNAGLLARRKAERALFLDPAAPQPAATHEPGLRPVAPSDEEVAAQGAAMWVGDQPDYGARALDD